MAIYTNAWVYACKYVCVVQHAWENYKKQRDFTKTIIFSYFMYFRLPRALGYATLAQFSALLAAGGDIVAKKKRNK